MRRELREERVQVREEGHWDREVERGVLVENKKRDGGVG